MSESREEGAAAPIEPVGAAHAPEAEARPATSTLAASFREVLSLLEIATFGSAFAAAGRTPVDFRAAGRGAALLPLLGAGLALSGAAVVGRLTLAPWPLAALMLGFLAVASGPTWLRALAQGLTEIVGGRRSLVAGEPASAGPVHAAAVPTGAHHFGVSIAHAIVLTLLAAGELAMLATLPASSHSTTLALALLLGRWATVIHLYGSIPRSPSGPAAELIRGLAFNPFAVASVSTMFVALSTAEAVGLVLLLLGATLALFLRIGTHRRLGGVTLGTAVFSGWIVEIAVLGVATLAALAFGSVGRG